MYKNSVKIYCAIKKKLYILTGLNAVIQTFPNKLWNDWKYEQSTNQRYQNEPKIIFEATSCKNICQKKKFHIINK